MNGNFFKECDSFKKKIKGLQLFNLDGQLQNKQIIMLINFQLEFFFFSVGSDNVNYPDG